MSFSILNDAEIKLAISEYREAYSDPIRLELINRREWYDGDIAVAIKDKIGKMFAAESAKTLAPMIEGSVNLLRYVVDELAMVYRYGASRSWRTKTATSVVDANGNERDVWNVEGVDEAYNRIADQADLDDVMLHAERMTLLCHDSILRYSYTDFGHTLAVLTRGDCDIVPYKNDPRRAAGIMWQVETVDAETGKAGDPVVWFVDAEKIVRHYGGDKMEEEPNKYAALNKKIAETNQRIFYPFIVRSDAYRDKTFWKPTLDFTVTDATVMAGVWMTYLNAMLKFCTFKQPYMTGVLAKQDSDFVMDFNRILKFIGQDISVGSIDYQAAMENVVDVLQRKLQILCICMNMPADSFSLEVRQQAGVTVRLYNRGLFERREADKRRWKQSEQTLARLIQFASNARFTGYPEDDIIPNDMDAGLLDVAYNDPPKSPDAAEDRAQWEWELKNKLATRADFIMEKNPGMSKEEAQKRVAEIDSENASSESLLTNAKTSGIIGVSGQARRPAKGGDETKPAKP